MRIGGSLEQSLNQGYRLDLKGVIQEGWQQTRRTGFGLLLAIVGVTAIWILLSNVLLLPYLGDDSQMNVAMVLSAEQLCYAFSRQVPDSEVALFQQALTQVVASADFSALQAKYLPLR